MSRDIFGEAAERAAGEEYGKLHAARYARWYHARRTIGWTLVIGFAAYVVARTYGAAFIGSVRTPLLYGLIGVCTFAAAVLLVYAYVRVRRVVRVRTRARRTRTYTGELYARGFDTYVPLDDLYDVHDER